MIVTTNNLNQQYDVKGIVRYYLSHLGYKPQLGRDMSMNEAIDFVIDNFLVKQAAEKDADAIIGFTINTYSAGGMSGTGTNLFFYGTAVKLK